MMASLALVPLTMSKARQPREMVTEKVTFSKLFNISPLSCLGVLTIGVASGSFWAMSPVCFKNSGLSTADVAMFISFVYLGGLVFQWPAGWLSDLINRKFVIALCSTITMITCAVIYYNLVDYTDNSQTLFILAFLYGAGNYPIYSLFVSLSNDAMPENMSFVRVSATLVTLQGVGMFLGPLLGSGVMSIFGDQSLLIFVIFAQLMICMLAIGRMFFGRVTTNTRKFVAVPTNTVASAMFDPRRKNRFFGFKKDI